MGRLYVATFKSIAVTAQQDFFELQAPADAVVVIHSYEMHQETEAKDAEEEQLLIVEKRGEGSVTSGSGGAAVTPVPLEKGEPAFGGTVERNNTTKLAVGTGAIKEFLPQQWNVRQPLEKLFTPETRRVISPSDFWALELGTTPADSIIMSGQVTFEEIGG
jgi:hypothetical protein